MLRGYPVTCTTPACPGVARYKIAAVWSDGLKHELKTYFLSCPECLSAHYALARTKHAGCVLADGESLQAPAVYERPTGGDSGPLVRRADLENDAGPAIVDRGAGTV